MSAFIFVCTCSSSFADLKESGEVHFEWQGNPAFEDLLLPWPSGADGNFAVQKAGHAIAFFILTCGLLKILPYTNAAVFSALYALATEVLQLYFSRSGRLLDVWVDCLGIALAVVFLMVIRYITRRYERQDRISQNRA